MFCVVCLSAVEPDYAELTQPDSLYLKNGHGYRGDALRVEVGRLIFRNESDEGTVEYSFAPEEIGRLDFSGSNWVTLANERYAKGDYSEAVKLMEPLYRQRAAFFAFMSESEIAWFQKLADAAYASGDYFLAVGVARNVRPFVGESTARQLRDLELLAHFQLPLKDKTKALANGWISEWRAYGDSALGWYVLGQMAMDDDEPEAALRYCLRPVVFSSQFKMDYLGHVYALAIVAAVELEDNAEAGVLLMEMKARGLAWPEEAKLESYRTFYEAGLPGDSTL